MSTTLIEVRCLAKQGVGFGYSRVRGLNATLATLTVTDGTGDHRSAPAQRACGSPRGAALLVDDAVTQAKRSLGVDRPVLVRVDSALC